MRRWLAFLMALMVLGLSACGGGGDDDVVLDEDEEATSSTVADAEALLDEGEEVFGDYIEALVGGNYTVALEQSAGAAAAVAGYFNTLAQIPSLPAEFQVPKRQAKLSFTGGKAMRQGDGTVLLDSRVEASLTGGGADEDTTYSAIKLRDENGKLVVVDFVRGEDGPVSEDVYETQGAKGEGNGIEVTMGPGFGMRGAGQGGTRFTNFVLAYTNNTQFEVTLKPTEDNKLYYAAMVDTGAERFYSSTTTGTAAAPGARGFGFVFINDVVEGGDGIFEATFVDEDDDEYKVKVALPTF